MSPINSFCRIATFITGSNRNILFGRINWFNPTPICTYTKKSAEEKLGIEKPKRPLTPFFRFMVQMRPALLSKNPGINPKEAIAWSSKHWQQLDSETKLQMVKEYEKDMEDYKKIKQIYESSLTEQQKTDIKRMKDEMAAAKEKRKLKAEYKELGRPKKPMSSYFLYTQSRKDTFNGKQNMSEYQQKVKTEWLKLPENEKAKFEKEAQELMNKYKKDLDAWKLKMLAMGRADLVPPRTLRQKKTKKEESSE